MGKFSTVSTSAITYEIFVLILSSCPYERSNNYEISSTACSPSNESLDSLNRSWTFDSYASLPDINESYFMDHMTIFDYDFEGIFDEISNDSRTDNQILFFIYHDSTMLSQHN